MKTTATDSNPCRTCGQPLHPTNGRCYRCRPGYRTGAASAAQRVERAPEPQIVEPAPVIALPRHDNTPITPADPELAALAALLSLSPAARGRVMRYLAERMREVTGG